jgi:hypothetical protein
LILPYHGYKGAKPKEKRLMKPKKDAPKRSRDAGTGRFVKPEYAEKHPKTTVNETIKPKPKRDN